MYKTDKLKSRIVEKYGEQKAFADAIGMNKSTLSRLLKDGKDWKGSMLMKAVDVLEIPTDEIDEYFFEPVVVKGTTRRKAK